MKKYFLIFTFIFFLNYDNITSFFSILLKEFISNLLCTFFEDETLQFLFEDILTGFKMSKIQIQHYINIFLIFIFSFKSST